MFTLKVDHELELMLRDENDAVDFFAVVDKNRAYLRPWMVWIDLTNTPEDIAGYIRRCKEKFLAGASIDLGIRYNGAWAGSVGLHDIHPTHRKAEVGYWLDESLQGKGIMHRSVSTLMTYGFDQLNLNRIWLRCVSTNSKSARVARKLGFTHEGTLRNNEWMYDRFEDDHVFGLLRSDWHSHGK